MNPFTVTFEIDLCGRAGFAVEVHGLVLYNVGFFWLDEEVWKGFRRIRGKGFWEFMKKIIIYKGEKMRGTVKYQSF